MLNNETCKTYGLMIKTSLKQKIFLIGLSVFLTTVILEVSLRIAGKLVLMKQEYNNRTQLDNGQEYRIMCIGESTTMQGGQDAYPAQLERVLNGKNLGINFKVINKGVSGVDTGLIVSSLPDNLEKYKPHMVIAMIGINDRGNLEKGEGIVPFWKTFRVYKLFNLLKQHIIAKINKDDQNKPAETIEKVNEPTERVPPEVEQKKRLFEENMDKLLARGIVNQKNYQTFFNLALQYISQLRFKEAIAIYHKLHELNPNDSMTLFFLGKSYRMVDDLENSAKYLKLGVLIDPNNPTILTELGYTYLNLYRTEEAVELFKKVIYDLNVKDRPVTYSFLMAGYIDLKKYDKAYEAFHRTIALNPKSELAYFDMEDAFVEQKEFRKAEEVLEKAVELNPDSPVFINRLAARYDHNGKKDLAKKYYDQANEIMDGSYSVYTKENYKEIIKIVKQFGAQLVCMQYPMRKLDRLKAIVGEKKDVIFIDNEKVFKEAVKKNGYDYYFKDFFAGDFGHAKPEGDKLLAENVANTILKYVDFSQESLVRNTD